METNWKRPWSCERLRAGGEGSNRGWDGWRASPTQWTWVWANSGRQWRPEKTWSATVYGVAKSWTWLSDWTSIEKSNSDSRSAGTSVGSQPITVSSPYPQVPHPWIQPTSKSFCVRLVESWDAEPTDVGEPATSQTCKKSDLYLYSNPTTTPITISPKWPGPNNWLFPWYLPPLPS